MTFLSDRRGASAVEFALVSPILIALVFGAIEFGSILYVYEAAQHASWDATRQLATNQISLAQASVVAKAELPSWVQASATITPVATTTDPNTNHYSVTITFPASAASPSNVLIWAYRNTILHAATSMQQEPIS